MIMSALLVGFCFIDVSDILWSTESQREEPYIQNQTRQPTEVVPLDSEVGNSSSGECAWHGEKFLNEHSYCHLLKEEYGRILYERDFAKRNLTVVNYRLTGELQKERHEKNFGKSHFSRFSFRSWPFVHLLSLPTPPPPPVISTFLLNQKYNALASLLLLIERFVIWFMKIMFEGLS